MAILPAGYPHLTIFPHTFILTRSFRKTIEHNKSIL